ncbi:MAG: hypothetical protein KDA84_20410 [Planctomycetaceae bacterium]|nr:hypothetical protein [Planctomycetaceae bacterium]
MSTLPSTGRQFNSQFPPNCPGQSIDLCGVDDQREPGLLFDFGVQQRLITPQELLDDEIHADLIRLVENAEETTISPVQRIVGLNNRQQDRLLEIIAHAGEGIRFRIDAESEPVDPFTATQRHTLTHEDLREIGQWRRLLTGLAGILYPNTVENAADLIRQSHRSNGLTAPHPQSLQREIREAVDLFDLTSLHTPAGAAESFLEYLCDDVTSNDAHSDDDYAGQGSDVRGMSHLLYFQDGFFKYDERHWQAVDEKNLRAQVVKYLQSEVPDRVTDSFVNSVITNIKGMANIEAWHEPMPFWISSQDPIEIERPQVIPFQNGLLHLDEALHGTGASLRPHSPRYFTTVVLPYDYDPTAECPIWEHNLREIMPPRGAGDHRIEVIQEFMGLTLVPNDTSFEKFLILVGPGGNGKSTLLRTIVEMLGVDNVSHVPLEGLNSEFRLHDMVGKLANIAMDMKRMDKMEEGRLKEIVSGEPQQINRKHKAPITTPIAARLIFSCNDLPQINDRSNGVWRRMIAMPFFETFTRDQVDRHRRDRLRQELPGIFNWAMAGAIRLYEQGGFTECTVCEQLSAEHRLISDPVEQFFDECVVYDSTIAIQTRELYDAYRAYCEDNGRVPKNSADFGKQVLSHQGIARRRRSTEDDTGRRPYEYTGVRLRDGLSGPGGQRVMRTGQRRFSQDWR